MKIILLKEVRGLGHIGEIKEVKEGYALNFLIPNKLGQIANKHSLRVVHDQKEKQKRQKIKIQNKKEILAKKINGKIFEIEAKADGKGTLYAGLDTKKISQELNKQGIKIEEKEIKLLEHLKNIGEHKLELDIAGQKIFIKLNIKS